MSHSAVSAKVFAAYLFVVSLTLIFVPNLLLGVFQMPHTSEVWIRVVGVTVFVIGVFLWTAGANNYKAILVASVYTRVLVFIAFTAFAVLGFASPMIILFGMADLLGGIWMHFSLKADAQQPAFASNAHPSAARSEA